MPLSQKKLSRITTHDVHDLIDQQVTSEATHLFKACRTFFRWTVRRRYIDRSPLDGLPIPNKELSRARVLSDAELKKIWDACSNETNDLPQHFKVIVKLLVCTGQRRGEVAALSPAYIKDNVCELPNILTKNSRTHIFPIGLLTKSLLKGLPSDKLLYFPARGTNSSKPFSGWSKAKIQLDQLSGVSDWTLHDIRRTVATRMAELRVAPHVVERILNHVTGTMSPLSRVYNRATFHSEMADAFQLWENRLSTILKN